METQKCVDAHSKEELEEIKEIIGKYSKQEKQTENTSVDDIMRTFAMNNMSCRCRIFHNIIIDNTGEKR